ncbi:rhodanese-like domain-containing protein [Roseospira visakhapatnamensis]|uniref:Rhodanese-related sulfurtransferase n=1 Tax=Roseospira visakhapatnamensis TaxID=390880 RepID=A0A7W6W891_9PROT|nr:rhodanese-like domain-containing protein [Roseospira visakhapatnamensis]MBB4264770.1 rhodanese-related sulfurtransferase [Roseospira visakhapatnamensis]
MFRIPDDDEAESRVRAQVQRVPAAQAIAWHAHGTVFVLDVREPFEFDQGHIPGAYLMPLSGFDPRFMPDPGDRRLLVHCAVGIRCGHAAKALVQFGYPDLVHRLDGGIAAWEAAGGPLQGPSDP